MRTFKTLSSAMADASSIAFEKTIKNAPALGETLIQKSRIPKEDGTLRNNTTWKFDGKKLSLISDTEYARRRYFEGSLSGDTKWFEATVRREKNNIPKILGSK